ncbi:claudin superfamily protein pickel [Arctopsyche grandis]|uniref:claudin superfamily protein pickel n=1 Tax=Arctopsyche grandis TaxID=121162 RepID=UPI00406D7E10
MSATDNEYPRATNATVIGAILTYIAGLFLLMSFASPYWIESYPEMFSSFKHMGLWEYCFDQFRYPYYQFPKLFNGCHYIFSQEYYVIREWLLPGWMMVVQALVTLALMLSLFAQIILALVCIRWPLQSILRYEWMCTGISFIATACASFFLFLAVAVFGGNCYRRDWLLYPSFNVLSWSYAFAVIAFMIFGMASLLLYLETKRSYQSRREAKNLVMQMQLQEAQPPPLGFNIPQRSGYI